MINKKAFTLIELLVVVAIIGILAAVGVTTFGGFQEKAKVAAVKQNHKEVTKYLQTELLKCDIGGELSIHTNGGGYKYYINWLTCARRGDGTVFQKQLFDNMANYFHWGKNWKNPFGNEVCMSCNNKDDAFEYFGGAPNTNQVGKMHCWWTGGGRGGGTGYCVSRFGSGANDILQTTFDANGY